MALVKYNNNSLSSVTSAAGFPAGALTHIKTLTASSSATLSFVDGSSDVVLDNTYSVYVFKCINIHPQTDNVDFDFQASTDGGSNYNTTMTTTAFISYHQEDGSPAALSYVTGQDRAQSTAFQGLSDNQGNGDDECCVGTLHLFNPSNTTFVKHFISRFNQYNYDNYSREDYVAGYFNTTSAINAVQFKFDSGNIDAGTIKLYGIKDS
tara:strand:+ start:650 stop:1273 length:624 start_codon:yes stop_codon:yes gene_type:complete